MLKITSLMVDPKCIGQDLMLVEVQPVNAWKDGKKSEEISAYKYIVACKAHGLEKFAVKIEGKKQLEPTDDFPLVEFQNLEVPIYWMDGEVRYFAKATGITLKSKVTAPKV